MHLQILTLCSPQLSRLLLIHTRNGPYTCSCIFITCVEKKRYACAYVTHKLRYIYMHVLTYNHMCFYVLNICSLFNLKHVLSYEDIFVYMEREREKGEREREYLRILHERF